MGDPRGRPDESEAPMLDTMLQAIQTIHTYSVVYPSTYWLIMLALFVAICKCWFVMGTLSPACVSSSTPPKISPARPRCVFHRQSRAIMVLLANLVIVGKLESSGDTIAATIALKVT